MQLVLKKKIKQVQDPTGKYFKGFRLLHHFLTLLGKKKKKKHLPDKHLR